MGLLVSKALTLLASPLGITLLLCFTALVLSYFYQERASRYALASAIAWLWLSSTSMFANFIYGSLENRYANIPLAEVPTADAIVVLGGGVKAMPEPHEFPDINEAGDRLLHGARLFKAGKAEKIVLSGGQVFANNIVGTEGNAMMSLLIDWGIPRDAIIVEGKSRTTHENAVETKTIYDANNWQNVLLVTSAAHMPRSVCSFDKAEIAHTPVPTDYEITKRYSPFLLKVLPSSGAQDTTARGMKEYLGRFVYWLRGQC